MVVVVGRLCSFSAETRATHPSLITHITHFAKCKCTCSVLLEDTRRHRAHPVLVLILHAREDASSVSHLHETDNTSYNATRLFIQCKVMPKCWQRKAQHASSTSSINGAQANKPSHIHCGRDKEGRKNKNRKTRPPSQCE